MLPLLVVPRFGLVVALGTLAAVLAARSVAYPVALSALPPVVVGLIGSNPFPRGAIFLFMSTWLLMALAFLLLRGELGDLPGAARWAIYVSAAFAVIALMRAVPGSYAALKLKLFIAQSPPLLLAGIVIGRRRRHFDLFVVLSLVVAGLSAVVLLRQFAQGNAASLYPGRFSISSQDNPISFGREAATGILLAVYVVLTASERRLRVLGAVVLPLGAIGLIASGSRGPVLGLFAGLLVALPFLLGDPVVRRRLGITVAAAVAAAFAVPKIVPATAIERSVSFLLGNGSGLSSNGRTHLWSEAWHAFVTHPLFGLGTGGFAQLEPIYQYPHNIVLETAAELGIVGLALLLAFLVPTARPLLAAWRSATGADRAAAALIAALLASSVVNALLSDSLEASSGIWFAAGLAYGLAARLGSARSEAVSGDVAPAAAREPVAHGR